MVLTQKVMARNGLFFYSYDSNVYNKSMNIRINEYTSKIITGAEKKLPIMKY